MLWRPRRYLKRLELPVWREYFMLCLVWGEVKQKQFRLIFLGSVDFFEMMEIVHASTSLETRH